MSEYFCKSLSTGSTSLSRLKATSNARRRRIALSPGVPRAPRRWKASDRTASQVRQGRAWRGACITAHGWCESWRLSRATKKPASTSTFLAIARGFQIVLLARAEVGWQAIHRADQIGDGINRGGLTPRGLSGALQALADNVGLRTLASARFCLDLRHEGLRQSYGDSFHVRIVLRSRQPCKTEVPNQLGRTSVERWVSRQEGFSPQPLPLWTKVQYTI
jgi:hypothetical protein